MYILDTKPETITKPTQTSFSLSSAYEWTSFSHFTSEPCGHIPSLDELLIAPFYPDPSQRILVLCYRQQGRSYVINVELLLELAREREGQYVIWEEWVTHTIEVQIESGSLLSHIWVSGCQLYCTMFRREGVNILSYLRIYDFSHAGRSKHLHTLDRPNRGRGTRGISPSLEGYKLPWNPDPHVIPVKGHDSIVFCIVSILVFSYTGSQLELFCQGSGNTRIFTGDLARVEPLKVALGVIWLKLVNTIEDGFCLFASMMRAFIISTGYV